MVHPTPCDTHTDADTQQIQPPVCDIFSLHVSMCPWLSSLWVTHKEALLSKVPTTRISLSLTRALPSFSLQLLLEHPTQKSGLDSKGRMWDLMQFVGEGGREEWMIYWLLYKSKAVVVISFQEAVMRFWPVFSPRWCDFVPDITMQLPCVCTSVCVWVCECLTLYDMLLWFYQEAQLKQHLYFCVHGGDKIWAPFSLSAVALCLTKYVHFRPFRKNI